MIKPREQRVLVDRRLEFDLLCRGHWLKRVVDVMEQVVGVEELSFDAQLAGLDTYDIDEIANQPARSTRKTLDLFADRPSPRSRLFRTLALEQRCIQSDSAEQR